MMQSKAIYLEDVVFRFMEQGKRNILDHVNLEIEAGTVTILMGSSGCGKSTLAAVASGLYPENGGFLEQGNIFLFGKNLKEMNPQERATYLTVMFQNPDLQFCMDTLRKEMYFCGENICIPAEDINHRIQETAQLFHVSHLLDQPLVSLSGGEKQKVALACLHLIDSKVVLLDEAFANIDRDAAIEILNLMGMLKAQGKTIIAIDHQADLWMDLADEIIILGEGAVPVVRGIHPNNIDEFVDVFEKHGLFHPAMNQDEEKKERLSGEMEKDSVSAICFRDVSIYKEAPKKKRWGRRKAEHGEALLEHVDADFPKGSMTVVLGSSGTGKTTTFLSVLKQHPYEGQIFLEKEDLKELRPREVYRRMGIVFQNPANQFITQGVKDEVVSSLKVWHKEMAEEAVQKRAMELLEDYGLAKQYRYSPYMLSQGQQRRLAVLSVLCGDQKVLLLDEPTYGQDFCSAKAIMSQIRQKMREQDLTVIVITHDRMLARLFADKVYKLVDKSLIEDDLCSERSGQ